MNKDPCNVLQCILCGGSVTVDRFPEPVCQLCEDQEIVNNYPFTRDDDYDDDYGLNFYDFFGR